MDFDMLICIPVAEQKRSKIPFIALNYVTVLAPKIIISSTNNK
jgi:hypothetical protein